MAKKTLVNLKRDMATALADGGANPISDFRQVLTDYADSLIANNNAEGATVIRDILSSLAGNNRIDISAVKNVPVAMGDTEKLFDNVLTANLAANNTFQDTGENLEFGDGKLWRFTYVPTDQADAVNSGYFYGSTTEVENAIKERAEGTNSVPADLTLSDRKAARQFRVAHTADNSILFDNHGVAGTLKIDEFKLVDTASSNGGMAYEDGSIALTLGDVTGTNAEKSRKLRSSVLELVAGRHFLARVGFHFFHFTADEILSLPVESANDTDASASNDDQANARLFSSSVVGGVQYLPYFGKTAGNSPTATIAVRKNENNVNTDATEDLSIWTVDVVVDPRIGNGTDDEDGYALTWDKDNQNFALMAIAAMAGSGAAVSVSESAGALNLAVADQAYDSGVNIEGDPADNAVFVGFCTTAAQAGNLPNNTTLIFIFTGKKWKARTDSIIGNAHTQAMIVSPFSTYSGALDQLEIGLGGTAAGDVTLSSNNAQEKINDFTLVKVESGGAVNGRIETRSVFDFEYDVPADNADLGKYVDAGALPVLVGARKYLLEYTPYEADGVTIDPDLITIIPATGSLFLDNLPVRTTDDVASDANKGGFKMEGPEEGETNVAKTATNLLIAPSNNSRAGRFRILEEFVGSASDNGGGGQNPPAQAHEMAYFGHQAGITDQNIADYDLNAMHSVDVQTAQTTFTMWDPNGDAADGNDNRGGIYIPQNEYIVLLIPANRDGASLEIHDVATGVSTKNDYTRLLDKRDIGGEEYNMYYWHNNVPNQNVYRLDRVTTA